MAHELAHVLFHLGRSKEENAAISIASFLDPIEKEANAFASELLMPIAEVKAIADRYGEDIRNPALMETVARSYNVSREALFYRLTEICFWNEKTQFASPFENIEPGENRVSNIDAQVPSQFLETAVAAHLRTKGITAQLAYWLFTSEASLESFVCELRRVQETEQS